MIVLDITSDTYHSIEYREIIDNKLIFYTTDFKCIPESNCRILTESEFKIDYLLKLQTSKKISNFEKKIARNVFEKEYNISVVKQMSNYEFRDWRINQTNDDGIKSKIFKKIKYFLKYFHTTKKKRNDEYQKFASKFIVEEIFLKNISEEEMDKIVREELFPQSTKFD